MNRQEKELKIHDATLIGMERLNKMSDKEINNLYKDLYPNGSN